VGAASIHHAQSEGIQDEAIQHEGGECCGVSFGKSGMQNRDQNLAIGRNFLYLEIR